MSLSLPRDWEGNDDGDQGSRRSPPAKRPRCCRRRQDTRDFYERQMELLKEMGCMSQGHKEKLESMSREIGATRDFYERQMELLKKEMRCMSQGHKEGLESMRREMQDFYQKIYPHFSKMSECSQRKQQDSVALMAEISRACGYVQQSPGSRISSNQNCIITLRLQFENSCSTDKYSTHEIEADDGTPLKVAIYDSNNRIITYEPFSSMRVHIVAIHGDFDDDHKGQWTEDYLRSNIVLGRPRKEHLLSGKLYFRLQNGVGYLNGVRFQDSSSFVPSKKFKLAVMADDQRITERVQEGITESFAVKDVRGYRYNTVMALWTGTGQAATVAQLVRADAGEVISMIIQAAGTARQNKKECEQLARRVFMIAELLPHLQDPDVMRREEVRRPLIGLGDTLREAHELVTSCQGRSAMCQFVTAGRQADRFREVQSRIDSYLLVFPFISHIDVTRRLDRIYNILLPNDSQSQEAAEVAQEVVPLPHGVGSEEFTFAELAAATNNFALDTVLGEGSFGTVYKGRLHDGRDVAIKRVGRMGGRWQSAHEFWNEMAILSSLRHMHIVRLFGWSVQKEERRLLSFRKKKEEPLLVFEYMNNGTLHDHLHRQTSSSSPVRTSWRMRIDILLGVSRAIEHLHCYAVPQVIHGDIKSSNVLLDASWVPRVSDFGVSITYDEADEAEVPICGTLGYIDPEYAQTGRLKPTSDVYSFGVVMLEVLTGKKAIINWEEEESKPSVPRTRSRMSLPIFALQSIEARELGEVLDRRPAVPEPTPRQLEAAELVARTAARCLRLRGEDRPAISDVVADLETALELVRCGE